MQQSYIDLGGFLGFPAIQQSSNEVVDQPKTYAAMVKPRLPEIDSLPSPVRDGTLTRIKIPQAAYEAQLEKLQYSLLGRLNFRFTTMEKLQEAAQSWSLREGVSLKSIGRGFVIFSFNNVEDMTSIWKRSPVRISKSTTEILARINSLSIAKAVGRPIAIDKRTRSSHYGHYARVCIDIDNAASRVEEVYVEREQAGSSEVFVFKQVVVFEEPTLRCPGCKGYGHRPEVCPKW
ncbi:uncharacterized protein LOC122645375 [Telopea speciosissima]|uniref:uncharacterized protein LOC122645375 n=1 Tax=Telopea speciosissima TaxID=54955 RepID=UPI001CC60C20|nr:uncharacterized protein LOC122645375 [Telopea speciosissima]